MEQYELYHFGVPGMKWGVRKAKQLSVTPKLAAKKAANYGSKATSRQDVNRQKSQTTQKVDPRKDRIEKTKRAVKIGAAVAGTVLAVYGAKKISDALKDYKAKKRDEAYYNYLILE